VAELHIAEDLTLPAETVTSTVVVYGGKGMGKTNFGSVLVEELVRLGLRVAILDPVGVWYGLRHGADGTSPGVEALILGGVHGDVEIMPTAGAAVADLVADEDIDVIVDISRHRNGSMWSVGEKIRFVADYCARLYERQGERRRPLHQVIDEAGRFVPQAIPSGAVDIARCVGAIEQLVELGRNVGVGVTLITQRSARMNKSVSELADAMVAFRTVGPRSIDAVMDWMGEHVERGRIKGLVEQLRELPIGSALVVSPGWLRFEGVVAMRARRTFDSSATPDATGEVRRASGPAAMPDLARYRARFAATLEQQAGAKGASRDQKRAATEQSKLIAEQQQQIADLERRLRERPTPTVERVEVPVLAPADVDRLTTALDDLRAVAMRIIDATDGIRTALVRARPAPAESPGNIREDIPPPPPTRQPAQNRSSRRSVVVTPTDLSNPQLRILEALASFQALGLDSVARSNVAVFADASPRSSGFANNLGALRTRGLIDYPSGGAVAITEDGLACVDEPRPIRSLDELHEAWYAKLPRPQVAILQVLVKSYPSTWHRASLAETAGQSASSSGFANNLGALRSLGLIDYPRPGEVVATDLLFPSQLQR
jgi:hypothetical protein